MKFVINFTNNYKLIYDLLDHEITNSWSNLIVNHTVADLCQNNHFNGYASKSLAQTKIDRLNYLADLINSYVPNKITKKDVTLESYRESLSVMHVHFPELKNNTEYQHIWNELSEYNDIIHWLEATLPSLGHSYFLAIILDFNKSTDTFLSIPTSAFELFTSECNFGDLSLHYTHVGKNASEIFMTNDLVCPRDQFMPQREFSASVRMHFYNNFHFTAEQRLKLQNKWEQFYVTRGAKEFWGYEVNDPKIAFGYMKIGSLSQITSDGNDYPIPKTAIELDNFRNRLVECEVIDWIIE